MVSIEFLQKEMAEIKLRNKRVEADKAWETSFIRKLIIALMTYFVVVLFFWIIKVPYFLLNALVPTAGFVLSTLTLPFIKKFWIKNIYSK
ncbi:hypothetical protein COY27_02440 [Candidatus Woesearchaeota archaeon CG_4_10_14_0_2_um_filter_33_13]|nr:MAG: hypothetical protein COY27_02440 [Candidatus Woesearchaeota archaeon CG_4_10_14_0_2_um_filter_33_13]